MSDEGDNERWDFWLSLSLACYVLFWPVVFIVLVMAFGL
jgi:hypothetical protein